MNKLGRVRERELLLETERTNRFNYTVIILTFFVKIITEGGQASAMAD
jgi:hypothetical protein